MFAGSMLVIVAPRRFQIESSGCGGMELMVDLLHEDMYGARSTREWESRRHRVVRQAHTAGVVNGGVGVGQESSVAGGRVTMSADASKP